MKNDRQLTQEERETAIKELCDKNFEHVLFFLQRSYSLVHNLRNLKYAISKKYGVHTNYSDDDNFINREGFKILWDMMKKSNEGKEYDGTANLCMRVSQYFAVLAEFINNLDKATYFPNQEKNS